MDTETCKINFPFSSLIKDSAKKDAIYQNSLEPKTIISIIHQLTLSLLRNRKRCSRFDITDRITSLYAKLPLPRSKLRINIHQRTKPSFQGVFSKL